MVVIKFKVKTRLQLSPEKYTSGMVGTFRTIVKEEGAGALLTGFGPTFTGYFIQGAFKFGGTFLSAVRTRLSYFRI
jgi:solute carrier family 25 (mitochondrial phosphate transporter), member 3